MYQIILPGQFLVSKSLLQGSYFDNSIVFIAQASRVKGCVGFIINRCSHIPLNEIIEQVPLADWKKIEVYLGGPVSEQEVHILHLGPPPVSEANEVSSGIWLGGDFSDMELFLDQVAHNPKVWMILGYTGWAPLQLEKEIDEGCWELLTVDPTLVFSENPRGFKGSATEFLDRYTTL